MYVKISSNFNIVVCCLFLFSFMFLQRAITQLVLDPAMVDRESWSITLAAIESMLVGRPILPDIKPLPVQLIQTTSLPDQKHVSTRNSHIVSNTKLMPGAREGDHVVQSAPVNKELSRTNTQKTQLLSLSQSRRSCFQINLAC